MDKFKQLKRQLRGVNGEAPVNLIFGTVKSVDGDTCTLLVQDFELTDVRLKSTTGEENRMVVFPQVGSHVTCISADGSIDNLTIIKVDKVAKIEIKEDDFFVEINTEHKKVGFGNADTSLYKLMDDLQSLLKQLKVYTPSGPSGTPLPDSVVRIEKFESDFKKLLIDV